MKLGNAFRDAATAILDIAFPPKCSICGNLGPEVACRACIAAFEAMPGKVCSRCGSPREASGCSHCRFSPALYLTAARAAGIYGGPLRQAIVRLKYDYRRLLGPPLGRYLAQYLESDPFGRVRFDLVVPIPLHSRREFEREFNQAVLIACEVSLTLSLPMDERCVQRIKATRPQVGLKAEERAANLRGAFRVVDRSKVQGKTILLIDDVATTLSTGNSCAESLLEAGASQVYLATVARHL